MSRLRDRAARRLRFRFRALDRGELSHAAERPPDNPDALTAAGAFDLDRDGTPGGLPPASWVKDYDDGRPRT